MAPSPAVVIIVRHGARLDAADKAWHLSSPTPYDPPLTYGGWTQSRALGARLASLLGAREQIQDQNESVQKQPEHVQVTDFASSVGSATNSKPSQDNRAGKRRKHKVFIHSSPFQRCVQTAIAIGAGIAQTNPISETNGSRHSPATRPSQSFRSKSSFGKSSDKDHSPILTPIKQGEVEHYDSDARTQSEHQSKPNLRLDAFLGEWLAPDYYESITPPPKSTLMVAGAKADLLRRGENIEEFQAVGNQMPGNFPGGWGSGTSQTPSSAPPPDGGPLANMSSIDQALPPRERSSSHGVAHLRPKSPLATYSTQNKGTYIPPQPAYALSPSEPIPRGYVAHAREACIDIDYQWDSMRPPQEWGDGGEFGEEWSAMHKRFRGGLSKMIQWYRDQGTRNPVEDEQEAVPAAHKESEDQDTDVVLVLVTHGAGCNALIGALTNQPVLLDVGMASLTMAVRKETERERPPFSPSDIAADRAAGLGRKGSIAMELSQEYDMRLLASSEHLRAGIDPTKIPSMSFSNDSGRPGLDQRRRQGTWSASTSPVSPFTTSEPVRGMNSSLGSIRRTSSAAIAPPLNRATTLHHPPAAETHQGAFSGLWNKRPSTAGEDVSKSSSPGHDFVLNFADATNKTPPQPVDGADERDSDEGSSTVPPMPGSLGRTLSQHGLWGSSPSGSRTERDKGPKRRWTLMQSEA
ncbi:MAG: hypothetical protein Q9157_002913 [Trypethelium eluteriae]